MNGQSLSFDWRGNWTRAIAWLGLLLLIFGLLQSLLPMRTAVQIGADEGFELAKATLCAHGYKLYTEIWNDQPPLHTFLITQIIKHVSHSILGPRLVTSGFTVVLLTSFFFLVRRLSGLGTAVVAVAMVIASPGFLQLSASCMLEIPGLSVAIAGLSVLANLRTERGWAEFLAGVLFGIALQTKLINLIWVPLAWLLICYRLMPPSQKGAGLFNLVSAFFLTAKRPTCIKRALIFGGTVLFIAAAIDLAVDQGAYMANFHQSWQSHFGAVTTSEYGTPSEHVFDWTILLKNWDYTLSAFAGIILIISKWRGNFSCLLPLVWLGWSLVIFINHTPWWPYYYVHIAIPLCWLAAMALVWLVARSWEVYRTRRRPLRRQKSGRFPVPLAGIVLFMALAATWMGLRVYSQVLSAQALPRTFSSLVIAEVQRYKPFTHWLYTDNVAFSFHTDIPMPPTMAVVPLKRLWAGEMTAGRMAEEFNRYLPELAILNADNMDNPFRNVLDSKYRLVYQDSQYQLYALTNIIAQAQSQ